MLYTERFVVVVVVVAVSSLARILGDCSTIHSLPALFFYFYFFLVDNSSRTLIPLFAPESVHSGSECRDDCGRVFPDKLCTARFRIGSHTLPGQRHSQLIPTSLGQGCMRV